MGDPYDFSDINPDGVEIGEAPGLDEVPENLEEEYNDIHTTLDQLDSCLDALEQQNDSLFSKLQQLLDDSIATRTELEKQNSNAQQQQFSQPHVSPLDELESNSTVLPSHSNKSVLFSPETSLTESGTKSSVAIAMQENNSTVAQVDNTSSDQGSKTACVESVYTDGNSSSKNVDNDQ